jgi:hypothetical protein
MYSFCDQRPYPSSMLAQMESALATCCPMSRQHAGIVLICRMSSTTKSKSSRALGRASQAEAGSALRWRKTSRKLSAPPLHQVQRQFLTERLAGIDLDFGGEVLEFVVQQTEQGAKGLFVATVRRGGD